MPQKDRKTVPDRVLTSVNELLALANMPSVALLYKTVRSKLINSEGPVSAAQPWCYVQMAFAAACSKRIIESTKDTPYIKEKIETTDKLFDHPQAELYERNILNMLAATGPWVVGRGIYRFDPDFCEELAKTEMTKIPYQQLMNMPEWCTYIPYVHDRLPENIKGQFEEYDGFFAYLEEDDRYHVPELRISNVKISQDESGRDKIVLEPIFIELISEDLDVCTHRIDFNALENEEIGENKSNNYKQLLQDQILYCLQLLLCICAENIEKTPVNLPAQKTNRQHLKDSQDSNEYMDSCRKWEVGTRIGAAIRSWKSEKNPERTMLTMAGNATKSHVHI